MNEMLQAENYSACLLHSLQSLQQADTLCDLTLMAENQPLRVHRVVMAASSDYFRALLTLDMKEKGQKVVTLKGVPLRGLNEVIRFAYSGQLRCSLDNISDVLLAATHLQLLDAINLCSKFLTSLTNTINSVDMYNIAEQFNLAPLKDRALTLILHNFEEIAKREDFLLFSPDFFSNVLADNRLKCYSELWLFQLVLQWIRHDHHDRGKYTFQLMSYVRFPLIPPSDMVEIVMDEPLMKMDAQCLELILEANKYHMLPHRQPVLQNTRTQVRTHVPSLLMLDVDDEGPRVFDLTNKVWGTVGCSPIETYHAQVCVLNNYMYVCGGIELYSSNNPVSGKSYRYDPRFNCWNEIASMREPRHHFTLVASGCSLFAIGGYCNGVYKNIVEQYHLKENRWVQRTPVDIRLSASAGVEHAGKIFLIGGQTDKGIIRTLWCYQTSSDTWIAKASMKRGRVDHSAVIYNNKIFAMGGYDKNMIKAYDINTVECYDIETNQWCTVFEGSPKISGINACLVGSAVYMIGGFSYDENTKRNEIWCYNLEKHDWHVVSRISSPAITVPCCALYFPQQMIRDFAV